MEGSGRVSSASREYDRHPSCATLAYCASPLRRPGQRPVHALAAVRYLVATLTWTAGREHPPTARPATPISARRLPRRIFLIAFRRQRIRPGVLAVIHRSTLLSRQSEIRLTSHFMLLYSATTPTRRSGRMAGNTGEQCRSVCRLITR